MGGQDLAIFAISLAAGILGALAGVGGGILVIPALTLLFGVDIHLAIGATVVSVIATSSGAAAAYVRDRLTDLWIGMFLELATTSGAVVGAILAALVAPAWLFIVLGLVLLLSAGMHAVRPAEAPDRAGRGSALATRLRLAGSYPDRISGRDVPHAARRIPVGLAMMGVAGVVSGLLGIGSGALLSAALLLR